MLFAGELSVFRFVNGRCWEVEHAVLGVVNGACLGRLTNINFLSRTQKRLDIEMSSLIRNQDRILI